MDFPFSRLGSRGPAMPIVPISFPQLPNTTFTGLVDSGAAGTRIHFELAEQLNIDLDGAETDSFYAGARKYTAFLADVDLTVGKYTLPTTVSFVPEWQRTHFLLGMAGFFEHFVIRIHAAKETTTLRPSRTSTTH